MGPTSESFYGQGISHKEEIIKMKEIKEFVGKLPHLIKDIIKGIILVWFCIMWLMMLPFIFIFDQIFGGWKNEKEKNDTRTR